MKSTLPQFLSVFDLDHTLLKVNSSYRFGIYLYQRKIISFSIMLFAISCYALWFSGLLSLATMQHRIFNALFLHRSSTLIDLLAHSFVDEHFDKMINPSAAASLQSAQQNGHVTAIFSSSPDILVNLIAKRFAVDYWEATHYGYDEQMIFTKIERVMLGREKAESLQRLAANLHISIDKTIAYSDSHHDMPFLLAAGTAIGVNPNRILRAHCKKYNWSIIK